MTMLAGRRDRRYPANMGVDVDHALNVTFVTGAHAMMVGSIGPRVWFVRIAIDPECFSDFALLIATKACRAEDQ